MRIGVDFDNTIVSYDSLFHKVALEQGLIPPETRATKIAVRDYLRHAGHEERWTEMQGYVYGARMVEAVAYPGAVEFFQQAAARGQTLAIVSHRTRHPILGPAYDLHAAARSWIERHLVSRDGQLMCQATFFELTKFEKLARIRALECDAFVDDMPEILLAEDFPSHVTRLLFDPEKHHTAMPNGGIRVFSAWPEIADYLRA